VTSVFRLFLATKDTEKLTPRSDVFLQFVAGREAQKTTAEILRPPKKQGGLRMT
jgi:hypothetical protein